MSQPTSVLAAAVRRRRRPPIGRTSATTAEGIAGEQALLAARRGAHTLSRATRAARRLESAARADARSA